MCENARDACGQTLKPTPVQLKKSRRALPKRLALGGDLGDVGNVRIPGLPDSLFLCTEVPGRLRPDTPETSLGCVAWMFPIADFFADLGSMTDMGHGQFCHLQIWQRSVQPLLCWGWGREWRCRKISFKRAISLAAWFLAIS